MEKKYMNFILIFMFCSLNYFLYFKVFKNELISLIKDEEISLILGFIFLNILFFILFFLVILLTQVTNYKKTISTYKTKMIKLSKLNTIKQKQVFEQAKQKSLTNLLSNIAHHWKQPLSAISFLSSSMQLYEEKELKLKYVIKNCAMINENVQFLSSIVDNLINAQKLKANSKKEVFRVDFMLDDFLYSNEFSDIQIKVDMLDTYSIYAYKQELFKVIWNILNNSKENLNKRSIENKKIFIKVLIKEENLIIKIKDNAGGIKDDIFDNIFEPYSTTKFKSRNIGLGLYLTYASVTNHLKGTIKAKNIVFIDEQTNKESKGAEFVIKIPRVGKL